MCDGGRGGRVSNGAQKQSAQRTKSSHHLLSSSADCPARSVMMTLAAMAPCVARGNCAILLNVWLTAGGQAGSQQVHRTQAGRPSSRQSWSSAHASRASSLALGAGPEGWRCGWRQAGG
eukprot:COSAG06_NODE_1383_length_9621_cov_17.241966_3_plen_119_part_00